MRIGKFYVEAIPDIGDHGESYFCRIYPDRRTYESGDGYIDEHYISPQEMKRRGSLEDALTAYLASYNHEPISSVLPWTDGKPRCGVCGQKLNGNRDGVLPVTCPYCHTPLDYYDYDALWEGEEQ